MNNSFRGMDFMAVVATICAVTLTGLVIRREFFPPDPTLEEGRPNRRLPDWSSTIVDGRVLAGSGNVTVLVFSDFECPACRKFHLDALEPVIRKFGPSITVVHRHFPLSYHRFSEIAARASECAAQQGVLLPMHHRLFEFQDSLGLKPFAEIAALADVDDIERFSACLSSGYGSTRVAADLQDARRLGLPSTPSVAIDGVLMGATPDSAELDRLISARLSGKVIPVEALLLQ